MINIKSVRFRLVSWFFLAFFTGTVIVFGGFYFLTRQIIDAQTDKEIISHGQQIADIVSQGAIGIHQEFPKARLGHEFSEIPGMLIVVADKNGVILTSSQPIDSGLGALQDILNKSTSILKPVFIDRMIGSTLMRIGVFTLRNENGTTNVILVGHPAAALRATMNKITEALIVALFVVGILSVMGGLVIAGRALRPITTLSLRLKQISIGDLNQRLEIPNTSDELAELSSTFSSLLLRLSVSIERERQFIGDMAHEIRTPLSTLKSTLEVALSKERDSKEYRGVLREALTVTDNLSTTINDVLDLAWAQSDNPLKDSEQVNLSELVSDLGDLLKHTCSSKRIEVVKEINPGVVVKGKRKKLFRALFNVTENAVKYTQNGGRIALTLEIEGERASIEVSNTGPGILPSEIPHVFDRFYRGARDSKALGSGLGLSICKSIIEAHMGNVSIFSTPKKITTVKITLPLSVSS